MHIDVLLQELQAAGVLPMPPSDSMLAVDDLSMMSGLPLGTVTASISQDGNAAGLLHIPELLVPMMPSTVCKPCQPQPIVSFVELRAASSTATEAQQALASTGSLHSLLSHGSTDAWLHLTAEHDLDAPESGTDASMSQVSELHDNRLKHDVLASAATFTDMYMAAVGLPVTSMDVPLLAPQTPDKTTAAEVLSQAMRMTPTPYLPAPVTHSSAAGHVAVTFQTLIAQELTVEDSVFTLPVIIIDEELDETHSQSKEKSWQQCFIDSHLKQKKTAHLELYMDWSLSDATCPCPAALHDFKRQLDKQFQPASMPAAANDSPLVAATTSAAVFSIIAVHSPSFPAISHHAVQHPEPLPIAIKQRLQQQRSDQKRGIQQDARPRSDCTNAQVTTKKAESVVDQRVPGHDISGSTTTSVHASATGNNGDAGRAITKQAISHDTVGNKPSAKPLATGVFHSSLMSPRPRKQTEQEQTEPAGGDMAFFLGLQGRAVERRPTQAAAPATALHSSSCPIDLCSDDDRDSADEEAEAETALQLPDAQHIALQLSDKHKQLLQVMRQDHAALLKDVSGIDREVCCDLCCY